MTTALATAARRAHALADILRDRAAAHPERERILVLAGHLDSVHAALAGELVAADDGPVPFAVRTAMREALPFLGSITTGVPAAALTYVLTPLTGRFPELHQVAFGALADEEQDLFTQIRAVRETRLDTDDDTQLRAALADLMALHNAHNRIGAASSTDALSPLLGRI